MILIPLKEDWLILLAEELFMSLREESEEAAETERDLLGALCQGLYELVTNEWVGGFHLTVGGTLIGETELASATLFLRQTLALGRVFNITDQIHLPWELKLERLVYSIPEEQRRQFTLELGDRAGLLQDEETLTTLETFLRWTVMLAKPPNGFIFTGIPYYIGLINSNRRPDWMCGRLTTLFWSSWSSYCIK